MVEGSASHKILSSDCLLELRATLLKSTGKVASFDDFILFTGLVRGLGETMMFLLLRGEKLGFFGRSSGGDFFAATCILTHKYKRIYMHH